MAAVIKFTFELNGKDDMMSMMMMDKKAAKPETNGLASGWSPGMQGMMSLIRVLPPDKYEEVMSDVKKGRVEQPSFGDDRRHDERRDRIGPPPAEKRIEEQPAKQYG
jgi:hypothetical protein